MIPGQEMREFGTWPDPKILLNHFDLMMLVPEYYRCRHSTMDLRLQQIEMNPPYVSPCAQNKVIPCYVARSKEKTLFIKYIFWTSVFGLVLITFEFCRKLLACDVCVGFVNSVFKKGGRGGGNRRYSALKNQKIVFLVQNVHKFNFTHFSIYLPAQPRFSGVSAKKAAPKHLLTSAC